MKNNVYKQLGKSIQRIRKEKKVTQEELADRLKVSVTYIGYVEQAARIPNLHFLCKIAKTLGVRLKDLFDF